MTRVAREHRNNVVIGAGEVYLDLFDAAGAKTGERYLGDAAGAVLAIATEETTVFSGTGAVAQELERVIRQITREVRVTLRDISLDNLSLFVIGDMSAGADVADEVIAVVAGRSYQLGVNADNPAGFSRITDVMVAGGTVNAGGVFTAAAGNAAWEAGTDYEIEAEAGRINVLDTAKTKVAMAAMQVDYKTAARVVSKTAQQRGAFRYVEDAAAGQGRNFYAPECLVRPTGDLSLLDGRNTEQQIGLTVAALEPAGTLEALYIDGQAA